MVCHNLRSVNHHHEVRTSIELLEVRDLELGRDSDFAIHEKNLEKLPMVDGGDSIQKIFVIWNLVYIPKLEGGLGIRRLTGLNEDCLIKMEW